MYELFKTCNGNVLDSEEFKTAAEANEAIKKEVLHLVGGLVEDFPEKIEKIEFQLDHLSAFVITPTAYWGWHVFEPEK